jgi:hypothetical protein
MRDPYYTFSWTEDTTTYSVNVPEGNYTISTLLTALETVMEAESSIACAFSVDSVTHTVSYLSLSQSITIVDSYLATALGFVAGQSGNSFTGAKSYNISGHDTYWSIQINNLPSSYANKKTYTTFKIPVTVDTGYVVYHFANTTFEQWTDVYGLDVSSFDITLVDAYGNKVDLNGLEWSFLISIESI